MAPAGVKVKFFPEQIVGEEGETEIVIIGFKYRASVLEVKQPNELVPVTV